jgi:hypothetical protein
MTDGKLADQDGSLFHLVSGWPPLVVIIVALLVLASFIHAHNFGSRLYDEAQRDVRTEGRYSIVQRRVTRRFFERLRARDPHAILYLASCLMWVLLILSLGIFL